MSLEISNYLPYFLPSKKVIFPLQRFFMVDNDELGNFYHIFRKYQNKTLLVCLLVAFLIKATQIWTNRLIRREKDSLRRKCIESVLISQFPMINAARPGLNIISLIIAKSNSGTMRYSE